jgi:hypothetical protein
MDYKTLLEHSFNTEKLYGECPADSHLEFLSENVFNFTTYDAGMSELFGSKAVEVCLAITQKTTFEYLKDEENHRWFLLMCNMPFFSHRIDWGTSIRGAWWQPNKGLSMELDTYSLWVGDEPLNEPLIFNPTEWEAFMLAVGEFAASDGSLAQYSVKR